MSNTGAWHGQARRRVRGWIQLDWGSLRDWPWMLTLRTLLLRVREDRLGMTAGSLTFTTLGAQATTSRVEAVKGFVAAPTRAGDYIVRMATTDAAARAVAQAGHPRPEADGPLGEVVRELLRDGAHPGGRHRRSDLRQRWQRQGDFSVRAISIGLVVASIARRLCRRAFLRNRLARRHR